MSIGRAEVLHVARLAELAVKEDDLVRLVDQLNRIVDYVAQLDRVPGDIAFRMGDVNINIPVAYSLCASLGLALLYKILKR